MIDTWITYYIGPNTAVAIGVLIIISLFIRLLSPDKYDN